MAITKRIILMTSILVICVSCDQCTKSAAQTYLSKTEVRSYFGDVIRLQLAHNKGAFLSLGSGLPETWRMSLFSIGVGLMLLIMLGYILFSKPLSNLECLAFSLLLAGGVGNLIDRLLLGYVVDFMYIGIGMLRTGVFNVADITVSAGVLVLIISMLRFERLELD